MPTTSRSATTASTPWQRSKRFEPLMAFDVRLLRSAQRRIEETIDYIRYVCSNEAYAKNLYETVLTVLKKLKTQEGFRVVDHEISELVGETVFRVKIDKYKLVYRVKEDEGIVLVFMFMHEAQPVDQSLPVGYKSEN